MSFPRSSWAAIHKKNKSVFLFFVIAKKHEVFLWQSSRCLCCCLLFHRLPHPNGFAVTAHRIVFYSLPLLFFIFFIFFVMLPLPFAFAVRHSVKIRSIFVAIHKKNPFFLFRHCETEGRGNPVVFVVSLSFFIFHRLPHPNGFAVTSHRNVFYSLPLLFFIFFYFFCYVTVAVYHYIFKIVFCIIIVLWAKGVFL